MIAFIKEKINEANTEHGLQFEKDFTSLNGVKKELAEQKFKEISESWGLKYENY